MANGTIWSVITVSKRRRWSYIEIRGGLYETWLLHFLLASSKMCNLIHQRSPTETNRQSCLIRITQLEEAYKWKLDQDRARLDGGRHGEIARQLNASTKEANFLEQLTPFRDCLQQFFTRLNEIQDELRSCQSIPTHELASQILVGLMAVLWLAKPVVCFSFLGNTHAKCCW